MSSATASAASAAAAAAASSVVDANTSKRSGSAAPLAVGGVQLSDTTSQKLHNDDEQHTDQLSADLALFLANPSLRAALADGSLDLSQYSDTVHAELSDLEQQCIAVYRGKSEEISALASDLSACDTVLRQLHEMLLGFQADLGGLSGEIRQLQVRSKTLDVQLKNRRAAECKLRHFLEHVVVAPAVAQAILTGPVNSTFLEAVAEVQQLHQNCHSGSSGGGAGNGDDWSGGAVVSETVAGAEMARELDSLRNVAMKRSRAYLLAQMALLRRPQTNVRVLQVHGLLKYAALCDFLTNDLRSELFDVYCESMSATLTSLFRTYSAQLLLSDATVLVTRHDTICILDQALLRDALTSRAKKRVDVCSLGTRLTDCLATMSQPIAAHVALLQKETYHYERLYSSWVGHLVDAVTNEHVFCRQFFKRDAFAQLFSGTLSVLTEQLENYLFTCYDALALLLMIKVTHQYRRTARQRKIHSLDSFFEQATKLLWPRLKTVMEGHLRSIQMADAVKLGSIDLHAHTASRRFGEFCCSLLLILHENNSNSTSGPSSPNKRASASTPTRPASIKDRSKTQDHQTAGAKLLQDLSEMADAFVALLERLSEEHKSQKKRTVFLINNLDHIVCIFQERRVTGTQCSKFVELLLKQREIFVEEELLASFSKMIAFVQQTEQHMAAGVSTGKEYDVNAAVVENLVLEFASNWKSAIEQINRNVLSYFSNFRNGMEILKHCLTQLLLYYTRFQDIIRKVWKNRLPAFSKDLVSTTVILAEIKKYALAI